MRYHFAVFVQSIKFYLTSQLSLGVRVDSCLEVTAPLFLPLFHRTYTSTFLFVPYVIMN